MKYLNSMKKRNKSKRNNYWYLILVVSAILLLFNKLYFSQIINFPNIIYLLVIIFVLLISFMVANRTVKFDLFKFFKAIFVSFFLVLSIVLVIFSLLNEFCSRKNEIELYQLKIDSAYGSTSRSSNRLIFKFKGEDIGLDVHSSPVVWQIVNNKDSLKKHCLILECRKGMLESYVVEGYEIVLCE